MKSNHQLSRIISMLLIGIFCFATDAFAKTTEQLSDRHDLFSSVTIESFEKLPDSELLQNKIGDYDKSLTIDLAGSKWYTADIPLMQTPNDLWLSLNASFIKDLLVITANPTNGIVKVYFESDLLDDTPYFQNSYWLKLDKSISKPPSKIFIVKEFRDKSFQLRNIKLMTTSTKISDKSNLDIFAGLVFGALFALLAYNLALAVQLKSSLHAFYAVYCLSNMLFVGWYNNGLGFQASWYDSLGISPGFIKRVVTWLYVTMTVLIIIKLLEPQRYLENILVKTLSYSIIAIWTIVLASYYVGDSFFLLRILNGIAILAIFPLSLMMAWAWRNGNPSAIYAILAFTPVFIIGILRSLVDQRGFFLTNGFQIISVYEMLILSWALTERVRRIRDEAEHGRERAERHKREIIQRLNEDLEHQVVERTKDLEEKFIELNKSNDELQNALDEISTLQGILPICSYCNHIRDDEGSWEQMESYISSHSDTTFSHGICPDCESKVRAEWGINKNK